MTNALFVVCLSFVGDAEESKAWVDECTDTKCPVDCTCDTDGEGQVSVDCSNKGLREVPQDLPEHVTFL